MPEYTIVAGQGPDTLKHHFDKFDNLMLVDGSKNKKSSLPHMLLTINNHQLTYLNANSPSWAKPLIDDIISQIKH